MSEPWKPVSIGIEWLVFCELWRTIGTFYTVRDAKPEERADPTFLAVLVVNQRTQVSALGVMVARLVDAVNLLEDDVEALRRRRR